MGAADQTEKGLVSVIIPCFNHGVYLPNAVASVQQQNYPNLEIIVVDDGSTDNTRTITETLTGVTYVYQENQGLSAARNTGIYHSRGEFLLFLDADDWLLPNAIHINVNYLRQNENLAFVSGAHEKFFEENGRILAEKTEVNAEHYQHLLKGNYIGMIATVMFQRWVFYEFRYDISLKNCEDYDLYLNIARKYPVYHHQNKIAVYRFHNTNMSGNIPAMLAGALKVLTRQKPALRTVAEQKAFRAGLAWWKNYYCYLQYKKLLLQAEPATPEKLDTLFTHKPTLFYRYHFKAKTAMLKSNVKKMAPAFGLRLLHKMGLHKNHVPAVGKAVFGDLDRTKPFSTIFGYDRGGPVDRYYIEGFLQQASGAIKGRVLEIGDNEYTTRFGGQQVAQSDILHVNDTNPQATIIGDISHAPQIPDNAFDCIVLTQTLHLIYNYKDALRTCYRILKPGGRLLLTVPGITPIDHGEWKEIWYWSFTDKAMHKLMAETFPQSQVSINTFGNVFTATAFLYGMGRTEIATAKMETHDPHYQVIVAVNAQKPLNP